MIDMIEHESVKDDTIKCEKYSPSNQRLIAFKDYFDHSTDIDELTSQIQERPSSSDRSSVLFAVEYLQKAIEEMRTPSSDINTYVQSTSSEEYTIHTILSELEDSNEEGKVDYLVNLMSEKFKEKSFFFIPQLCLLVMNKSYTNSLSHFILTQCINKMKFSVLAYWMISSYGNYSTVTKKNFEKYISLIEMTLVNGSTKRNKQYKGTDEDLFNNERDKEFRTNYFNIVLKFYNDLKVMCEKLKNYQKENKENPYLERNSIMRAYLKSFNKRIVSMYEKESEIEAIQKDIRGLFRGILLPFDDTDSSENNECDIIVNFLPEYSSCFNTKARVPVKVVFECVKEKDLADYDKYYSTERCCFENHDELSESSSNSSPIDKGLDDGDSFEDYSPINRAKSVKSSLYSFAFRTTINESSLIYQSDLKEKEINIQAIYCKSTNSGDQRKSNSSLEEAFPFGEPWTSMQNKIKSQSKYGMFPSYSVKSFMAKANDDLRQELLTMQLIKTFNHIFNENSIPLNLHPYEIVITSSNSGLIEYIPNTLSIDAIKKLPWANGSLNVFFRKYFADDLELAQRNFARSLAAYSLMTYIIDIKDRHNGNILLDMFGNIIHIDYGFILGISPGNMGFEKSPFKLTKEYVDILDGERSTMFQYFKSLMLMGLTTIKERYYMFEKIIQIASTGSNLPCFDKRSTNQILEEFKKRFHLINSFEQDESLIVQLIKTSMNNWRTIQYDRFQKYTNDICS